jgi:hypothetical protein
MNFKKLALLTACLVSILSCATLPIFNETLEKRVNQFWEARVKGDFDEAYRYERISQTLKGYSKQEYIKHAFSGGVTLQSFKIKDIKLIDDDTAEVYLEVVFKLNPTGGIDIKTPIQADSKDKWVKIDGQWYHVIVWIENQVEY